MEPITILVFAVVLLPAMMFATGCSFGRGYAKIEIKAAKSEANRERHQRLIEKVTRERIEKENVELRQRLTDERRDYYKLSEQVIPAPRLAKVLPLVRDDKSVPEAG